MLQKIGQRFFLATLMYGFLLIGCRQSDVKIPPDVLTVEQMTAVLTEMQVLESAVQRRTLNGTSATLQKIYGTILAQHGLTSDQYKMSSDFYHQHPELMEEIYNGVLKTLSERNANVSAALPPSAEGHP